MYRSGWSDDSEKFRREPLWTDPEGRLSAIDLRHRFRFNDFVVKALLEGALEAIRRHGGDAGAVDVAGCPVPTRYP